MELSRQSRFHAVARQIGHTFNGEIRIGGNYVSAVRNGNDLYISGQIPRVNDTVMVTGRVGEAVTLEQAQYAAKLCTMRALAVLIQQTGSLDHVKKVLRINVFVNSAADFTQQSEVADGASEVLYAVLGDAGAHTRTSVGVYQLPKGASVEVDMLVALEP